MHENNCCVYAHVNLINGKKYFGITVQEPEKRWQNGHGYYNNVHFKNAILKYGWGNFGHFVLYRNIPIKIAKNIEEMLIREHMSHDPRFGYNRTHGGELERPSEETCRKISDATKEVMNRPDMRKKVSEATREAMKRPEVLAKISKPVEAVDPETGRVVYHFKSTQDAGRAGFSQGCISECCNGKKKKHRGYIWRYVKEVSENDSDN